MVESQPTATLLLPRSRVIGTLFSAIWLLMLVQPISDLLDSTHSTWQKTLGLVGIAAFIAGYLGFIAFRFMVGPHGKAWIYPALLLVLAFALLPVTGESGLNLFVFVAVVAQLALPARAAVVFAVVLVAVVALLCDVVPGWGDAWNYTTTVASASMAAFGIARILARGRQRVAAQAQRAELAILAERERFARDLHDILGHSLTVITVKSELAGKLIALDPVAARREITDIERLAREALSDVRSTLAGVREVTLVSELSSARLALEAADIAADLPNAVDEVPGERREVLGYVVREAVTNVVRHSNAGRCGVQVSCVGVDIIDDGDGTTTGAAVPGLGLNGLRRRVEQCGGVLEAGPNVGGGFRVSARFPEPTARSAGTR